MKSLFSHLPSGLLLILLLTRKQHAERQLYHNLSTLSVMQFMDFVRVQESREDKGASRGTAFRMTLYMKLCLRLEFEVFPTQWHHSQCAILLCLKHFRTHPVPTTAQWVRAQQGVRHYIKEKPPAVRDAHTISFEGKGKRKQLPACPSKWWRNCALKINHTSQESTVLTQTCQWGKWETDKWKNTTLKLNGQWKYEKN